MTNIEMVAMAGGAMFFKDIFSTAYVKLLGDGHNKLAGWCDGIGDCLDSLSKGTAGANVAIHGFDLLTIFSLLAILIASRYGTSLGATITSHVMQGKDVTTK